MFFERRFNMNGNVNTNAAQDNNKIMNKRSQNMFPKVYMQPIDSQTMQPQHANNQSPHMQPINNPTMQPQHTNNQSTHMQPINNPTMQPQYTNNQSSHMQPVNNQNTSWQGAPMPMQSLPLFLQQPEVQMQPGMQIPSTILGTGQQTQFTDYEQLSMLNGSIPVTAESLQYLNGYLRTQIGRRVKVEFLIGTSSFVDKEGILLGVGVNFILINETDTDDLTACDFYNIKFIKFYY
jgi:hypothetical protein